jgi:tetratricopeptide (TPR) repeat protein
MHPANVVLLLSLGFSEEQAKRFLEFFNGRLMPFNGEQQTTPRDRVAWFWIFINLRMTTSMFESDHGFRLFFAHATTGCALPQEFANVAQAAFSQFDAQVPKCGQQPTRKAQSCGGAASVAGSDFSTMTQTGGYLWKFHAALSAISRLLNEWFSENEHLMNERARMSEESLIETVLRVFVKMQCSKTGQFGNERTFSTHIYIKLMQAFWKAKKANKRFTLRLYETFSSILCATGNYEAAIEWLSRALQCEDPEAEPTHEEIAILKFAFIAISLGVQSLASCTPENLGALFAHIFDDEELEVDSSEAAKFQSAINRVAEDFETEPQATHDSSEVPTPERHSHGRGRGGAAVGGGHAAHRASKDARSLEFEKMLQEAAADPARRQQLMEWLANSK